MKLDASRSRIVIHTFAEGLFSALAHDLELVAGDLTGEATETSAEIHAPVASIRVTGVIKRGMLDASVLSAGDRATIERQVREEVLPGGEIVARGTHDGVRASIEVVASRGRALVTCEVAVTSVGDGNGDGSADGNADGKRARGKVEVSLAALGAPPVRGPMGAFRVRDRVRVEFELVFA